MTVARGARARTARSGAAGARRAREPAQPHQFVVQLENRVGELARLSRALALRGIDLRSVSLLGGGPVAWAAIIPDDAARTRDVLRSSGYRFVEGEPLVVEVEDRPGGLADVAERLAAAGVSILASITISQRPGVVQMALTVDDQTAARRALVFSQLPASGER